MRSPSNANEGTVSAVAARPVATAEPALLRYTATPTATDSSVASRTACTVALTCCQESVASWSRRVEMKSTRSFNVSRLRPCGSVCSRYPDGHV